MGIFVLNPGTNVNVYNLTLANGNGASVAGGGAIYSNATLNVTNAAFTGNTTTASGGAINSSGLLTVNGSTFSGNSAGSSGGAINQVGPGSGAITIVDCTFYGNSAPVGAAISIPSTQTTGSLSVGVTNSTFTGNTGGAAIDWENAQGGQLTVADSLLTADASECNASGQSGCPANGSNGNVVGVAANLAPLGWYGGPTQTMIPLPGSPAICAGISGSVSTDQRGFALDSSCSGQIDAGAVQTNYLIVTTTNDTDDGACTTSLCTLRDALTVANSNATGADIAFAPGLTGTITLACLGGPLPWITGNLNLMGPGAGVLSVAGNGFNAPCNGAQDGLLNIGNYNPVASPTVAISGLTFANGGTLTGYDGGGGITQWYGNATISGVTITGCVPGTINVNGKYGGAGGGIFLNGGTLVVNSSTISGNYAGQVSSDYGNSGGGMAVVVGAAVVNDSTFYGNQAGLFGGAIAALQGYLAVNNSTFSGNSNLSAPSGAISSQGAVTVSNSLFTGDNGFECLSSGLTTPCAVNGSNGNVVIPSPAQPILAALANNGGPTQTMLPLPGSAAICAGAPALVPGGLSADQRGFPRLNTTYSGYSAGSPCLDAGAVQTNYQSVQFTNAGNSGYSGSVSTAISTPAAPIVSVTESGQNIGGVPVTLSFSGTGTASGLGPVTTVAGAGATFNGITVDQTGDDTLSAALNITNSVSITTGNVALDISSPATSTTVSSSQNPSTYGQSVTFTAIVSPASSGTTPAGSISFSIDGGVAVGGTASTCPLSSPANSFCATTPLPR